MAHGPQKLEKQLKNVLSAWKQFRPDKAFNGVTLEQFEALTKPSRDVRARMSSLKNQLLGLVATRNTSDAVTLMAIQNLANSVKGDSSEGEDGEFYGCLGYVRKSERKRGLTRRTK